MKAVGSPGDPRDDLLIKEGGVATAHARKRPLAQ